MNAVFLSALPRCSAIHTWAWQRNITVFICHSPLSSILFSSSASSFVHISMAGLAKLKMSETQRQTVVSTVTVYGKAVCGSVFVMESSKVTGSIVTASPQRKRWQHLVHWLLAFQEKSSTNCCLRAMDEEVGNVTEYHRLETSSQPSLYMSRFMSTGMREREADGNSAPQPWMQHCTWEAHASSPGGWLQLETLTRSVMAALAI